MSLVPSAGDMQHCPSPTPADAIGVPLHIRVRETSLAHEDGWPFPHTLYHIVTTQQGQQFAVQRRFRDALRAAHPDHGGATDDAAKRINDLTEARRILLS